MSDEGKVIAKEDPSTQPFATDGETEALRNLREATARRAHVEAVLAERELASQDASKDQSRIYNFLGPINFATAQQCMDVMGQWVREDASRNIRLIFNSPGGSVIDGLALIDYINEIREEFGTKITTVALGFAASMAAVVLQAGDERVVGRNAYLMLHEISNATENAMSVSEIEDTATFTRQLNERLVGILASKANIDEDEIKKRWERRDWWLNSDEALELGLCDAIQ